MNFTNLNRNVALAGLGGLVVGAVVAWLITLPSTKVVLTYVPEGATVYVDNNVAVSHALKKRVVLSGIEPGNHTILVAGENLWPWAKTIRVTDGDTSTFGVTALTVTMADLKIDTEPEFTLAGESSALRDSMRTLPSADQPLRSADGNVSLWMEGTTIKAAWRGSGWTMPEYFCNPECSSELVVLPSEVDVRSLSFYGERSDVILFAAGSSIFALELDKRGTQNFQPLYKGKEPIFSLLVTGTAARLAHVLQ